MEAETKVSTLHDRLHQGFAEKTDGHPLLRSYGEMLLAQGPPTFFWNWSGEALAEFVATRFAFVEQRISTPFSLDLAEAPSNLDPGVASFSILEIVIDDRPFLIDSIQSHLLAAGIEILAILHPILRVRRDRKGAMEEFDSPVPGERNESHIFFIVNPVHKTQRQSLLEELRATLYDIVRSVDDYPEIKSQLAELRKEAEDGGEASKAVAGMLNWFVNGNFIFMGVLPYQRSGSALHPTLADGLGYFHPDQNTESSHEALIAQTTRYINAVGSDEPFLMVEESTVPSRMHNRVPITVVLVSTKGKKAKTGPVAVAGIFTNRSLRADVREIPVVADKIKEVVQRLRIVPDSYRYKEALDFFNGLPRFELFRLSESLLESISEFVLSVVDQPRVEVAQLHDPEARDMRIMVTLPGPPPSQEILHNLRERVEAVFNLTAQNQFVLRMSNFSVLNLVMGIPSGPGMHVPAASQIEMVVREELLTRDERLVRLWRSARGSDLDEHFARSLVLGLPEDYKLVHAEMEIFSDLAHLERLARTGDSQFALRHAHREGGMRLVLYALTKFSLSQLMPIFNNLRVLVEEEETFEVRLADRPGFLHTFLLHPPEGVTIDPARHQDTLMYLIFNILEYRAENDPLNALLLYADFDWRAIALMQLYRNYLMQVGTVYTRRTINETLIRRHDATRALFAAFEARFDPDVEARDVATREANEVLADRMREIDNLTEDRIFKSLNNLVQSTLRTNYYRDSDDPVLAVKLSSRLIDQLPSPRPLFEISVFSSLMEGIHLRGDMIARGGIRYSDRPDDFRTEVLGLMHTQMKKNALIVPLGSKGGFVVKDLTPFQGNPRAAGDDRYRVFIQALLSVTDNLEQGRLVPPPRVVRHDEDDPYLVVAADKGTAHLSDTANAVSQENGFWLGDAFASGGSNGYDHKKVGITARGAWESVKRLFWDLGVNIQKEPVTVVGVGDMSGDVFGNGMLLSRTLKLVGAFDHRHIFLDPNPDPEVAYAERERLFQLPRSAWSDYNKELISEGGGVFPRNAKEIALSSQLKSLLDVEDNALSGEEMIRALLAAEVDLIWNGGIGTYVKSTSETNGDVGDPNNDSVRIDSSMFKARVVGEGGNLGFTQNARIDIDFNGGAIHTDAIDNAGGVNMSDQEVNLKILLGALMDTGAIDGREARNRLLEELEDSVSQTVLRANFRQVMMISMDRERSMDNVEPFLRLTDLLAMEGGLDRRTEAIPNPQRLRQNFAEDKAVPRPVLAVLLAYTKMILYKRLVASDLVDQPSMDRYFRAYFPRRIQEDYDLESVKHPLRREIIGTVVTNIVVDQAGMCFVPEMASYAGIEWADVVQAYLLADDMVNGPAFREEIYAQATQIPAEQQYRILTDLEDLLAEMVRWLLFQSQGGVDPVLAEKQRHFFAEYCDNLAGMVEDEEKQEMEQEIQTWIGLGLEADTAKMASQLTHLKGFPLVCSLALEESRSIQDAFVLLREVEERMRFSQLETALLELKPADPMQKRFIDGLMRSLTRQRQGKLAAILTLPVDGGDPSQRIEAYLSVNPGAWQAYEKTVRQILSSEHPDAVSLAVAMELLESV